MAFLQNIKDIKRFKQVISVLFKQEMGYVIAKMRLKEHLTLQERLQQHKFLRKDTKPYRIKLILEELGGSFVKLGQLLSVRPDLIPHEYCVEFAKLQDEVKPFAKDDARKIIESELKKPIHSIFTSFKSEPIAAASIGQVHMATLKNGKKVVVKVQRPNISEIIKTDIDILYHLSNLLEKHFELKLINPKEIIREFERYSEDELDYLKEAKNIERFYKNFESEKKVKIPKCYKEYSTSKILTLEYIKGKKLSELNKDEEYDKKKIAENIVNCIFKQVFVDGFFHADPHPGNVLALHKNHIGLLDFGIVGKVDEELKGKLGEMFIAMINGKSSEIAKSLINMGMVEHDVNMENLKDDLYEELGEYHGAALRQIDLALVFSKLLKLASKYNIKMPVNFVLLGKSIITLQGLVSTIHPNFNLVGYAKPFVKRIITQRKSPKYIFSKIVKSSDKFKEFILNVPDQTTQLLSKIKDADINIKSLHKDIKSLTVEMDRSSNRVVLGMIIAGLIVSGSLLMQYDQTKILNIPSLSFFAFLFALLLFLILLISILREKTL